MEEPPIGFDADITLRNPPYIFENPKLLKVCAMHEAEAARERERVSLGLGPHQQQTCHSDPGVPVCHRRTLANLSLTLTAGCQPRKQPTTSLAPSGCMTWTDTPG